jgi:hypothetical protein
MNGAFSAIAATPIWYNYMMAVKDQFPIVNYPKPSDITTSTIGWISNQKPTSATPKTITDIFAPWQLPTTNDSVFVKDKVAYINGSWCLATDSTPASLVQEKTYANIQSEMPNDPFWENPVRAWAVANNYGDLPPTNTCNISSANKPTVQINSPGNNASISGNFTISASVNTSYGFKSATFYLDGTVLKTFSALPFTLTLNTNDYSSGTHSIRVVAIDKMGLTNEATINVTFNVQAEVTNLTAAQAGAGSVNLTWTNPSGISFVRVYRSSISGSRGNLIQDNLNANSFTDTGLASGTYYYTITTVDSSNDESTGATTQITI